MTLKRDPTLPPSLPATHPGWGELAANGDTAEALRFCVADREVSFPCHVLHRWELQAGATDSLVLLVGDERITIEGQNLAPLRDALDDQRLRVVRLHSGRSVGNADTRVTSIRFEPER